MGRQGIRFASHNAYQKPSILPSPVSLHWKSPQPSPTLFPYAFSKSSHPKSESVAEQGPFIISPSYLNISPPNSRSCSKYSFNQRRVSFLGGEIYHCYWNNSSKSKTSLKTWNWREFCWFCLCINKAKSRRGSRVLFLPLVLTLVFRYVVSVWDAWEEYLFPHL